MEDESVVLRDEDGRRYVVPDDTLETFRLREDHRFCRDVLRDHRLFSSDTKVHNPASSPARIRPLQGILNSDPPCHTRLRQVIAENYAPRAVARLESYVQATTDTLLDAVASSGRMDLVEHLAKPLPFLVNAKIVGVPAERRADVDRWADILMGQRETTERETATAREELLSFFAPHIDERRREPRRDVISALIEGEREGVIATEDIAVQAFFALVIGNDTTKNMISGSMLALAQHPNTIEQLRAEPQLVPAAIEEILRYYPPMQAVIRLPTVDAIVDGRVVRLGEPFFVWIAAANRDGTVFEEPDRFNIRRSSNPHLSFGHGIHYCLGAEVARLIGRVSLSSILSRFANLQFIQHKAEPWQSGIRSVMEFSLNHLWITFDIATDRNSQQSAGAIKTD
jgi:cytochrome P450 family 109